MAGDAARLLLVAAVGIAGGALTAVGQEVLPDKLGSLANSAGPWGLCAFALALLARTRTGAAAAASLALAALVTGYYVTDQARGYPASSRTVLLWMLAAVTAGPVLGLAAHWLRVGRAPLAAVGAGLVAGTLAGEGIYGLRYISDTTYPPYWQTEIAAGAALLVGAAAFRLRSLSASAIALAVAAATAAVVTVAFSQDLLTRL